jgi:hypothetical protein
VTGKGGTTAATSGSRLVASNDCQSARPAAALLLTLGSGRDGLAVGEFDHPSIAICGAGVRFSAAHNDPIARYPAVHQFGQPTLESPDGYRPKPSATLSQNRRFDVDQWLTSPAERCSTQVDSSWSDRWLAVGWRLFSGWRFSAWLITPEWLIR